MRCTLRLLTSTGRELAIGTFATREERKFYESVGPVVVQSHKLQASGEALRFEVKWGQLVLWHGAVSDLHVQTPLQMKAGAVVVLEHLRWKKT